MTNNTITTKQLINYLNTFPKINNYIPLWEILYKQHFGDTYPEEGEEGIEEGLQYLINSNNLFFTNMETGEILWQLNNKTLEEEYRAEGFNPSSLLSWGNGVIGAVHTPMLPRVYLGGFYSSRDSQTFRRGAVMIHKPPMEGFWAMMTTPVKIAEIVSAENGKTEHEFYGSCNDFEDWFLAMAVKAEKFFVKVMPTADFPKGAIADEVNTRIGILKMNDDYTWQPK